ncbi:MAG TPA: hypothetical protein VF622_13250 [Segetibacter sp.]|jgi:glutathione synthase/RimK-type ligase-like ATP-grasp enzyme
MILIITHKEDYTSDFLIGKLNSRNIPYFRFNCEDCLKSNISLHFGNAIDHSILTKGQFNAVWYRRTKLPSVTGLREEEELYVLNEIDAFLSNLFQLIKAKWLSRPAALQLAENKLLQLSLAQQIGFNIPKTLVTTNRDDLGDFFRSNEKTIIKPIGSGRVDYADDTAKLIFSNIVPTSVIDKLETFELTPAIFQEYIDKEYELRITVVDNSVFAAKVNSQSDSETIVDWRRKHLVFEPCDIPDEIGSRCLAMLKALNISFGAFDFIKASNGEYYFLEVNPNGQWAWIEMDTGLKISDAIINYLLC